MAPVKILKRIKTDHHGKMVSIPCCSNGRALPEGRYYIEWYAGGRGGGRVTADVTKAEALEVARRKRHGNRPQQLTVVHFLEHFHGYPFDERRYPLGLT